MRSKQYQTPYYKKLFARMKRTKQSLERSRKFNQSRMVNGFFGDQKYWFKKWDEENEG